MFLLQDIVVRVSFILGNMTAKNDNARVQLFQQPKSLDILLTVLKTHLELDYKVSVLRNQDFDVQIIVFHFSNICFHKVCLNPTCLSYFGLKLFVLF
jgi:hypothetical protein